MVQDFALIKILGMKPLLKEDESLDKF